MGRLLNSFALRLGLVFLVGLLALQLALAAAILWPEGRPTIFRLVSPRDAAAMARALEAASPVQRALIVEALNSGGLIVQLHPDFPPDAGAPPRRAPRPMAEDGPYMRYRHELEGRPFRVQVRSGAALGSAFRGRIGAPGAIRLAVRLRTGQVLVVERAPVLLQRVFARSSLIAATTAAVMLLVMLISLLQVARPARRLARAADRLASDIDMPDLPVRGADEIRTLSAAFNSMKRRIRGLIDERTRMLAAIAHDLRTYLTRLRLRVELIDDPEQRASAVRDLDDMAALLEDTLAFATPSGPTAPPPEAFDVTAALREFVALRAEMREPVGVEGALPPGLVVRCGRLALRRMLANLTDNALRYAGAARLSAGRDGAEVWIRVDDDGPGVPAAALPRLVEPFERLEPSRGRATGGAGLGLAIVDGLAREQGGRLVLGNRARGGFRAELRLPAASEPAAGRPRR